jgi:transcriptional regulator with XRE-family HTH domain
VSTILGPLALVALPDQAMAASVRQATAIAAKQAFAVVGFVFAMGGSPTSSTAATVALVADGTSAMPRMVAPTLGKAQSAVEAPGRKIAEARRLSGLTWEELAAVMGVTRRTLHLWANGRPIGAANQDRLSRLLVAMRTVERGTSRSTRAAILNPISADGRLPLDLLAQEKFQDFIMLVGRSEGRIDAPSLQLSPSARAARTPPPPLQLLGALQGEIETSARPRVLGKTVRQPARQA